MRRELLFIKSRERGFWKILGFAVLMGMELVCLLANIAFLSNRRCSWGLGIGDWALGIGQTGRVPYFPENRYNLITNREGANNAKRIKKKRRDVTIFWEFCP